MTFSPGINLRKDEETATPLGFIYHMEDPIFDVESTTNVTGVLGSTGVLNCRVKNIGNKTVSENRFKYRVQSLLHF